MIGTATRTGGHCHYSSPAAKYDTRRLACFCPVKVSTLKTAQTRRLCWIHFRLDQCTKGTGAALDIGRGQVVERQPDTGIQLAVNFVGDRKAGYRLDSGVQELPPSMVPPCCTR